ncbi:hypothetical protein PR202_gb22205 [Eleusine coracana subsp. coracana]|uniref:Uncharacterized protein n=1 Tax=Eleusine coracana subsp. coracana TaxID=191504 RepID=A0AAV5FH44_ELECO|nr:hypothetical protein PR202_gb22205 [Eleusine coracana subsp. coracana]
MEGGEEHSCALGAPSVKNLTHLSSLLHGLFGSREIVVSSMSRHRQQRRSFVSLASRRPYGGSRALHP